MHYTTVRRSMCQDVRVLDTYNIDCAAFNEPVAMLNARVLENPNESNLVN